MSSLALELQLVFGSACAALQAGEGQEALDNYFLARSRVRFVLEGILGDGTPTDDPAVAVVVSACRQVECTFSWALDRLTQPGGSSSLSADGTQQDSLHPESCRAVGAGLLEAWPGLGPRPDAGAGGADERGLQDVIQRCLREVSGSLDDVVGLAALKQELREAVLLPLHLPHLFTGIRRPQSNVLFHGRPGTGKTLLVEKAAAEAGLPLLALSPSAVLSKWAGESEKTLRGVFEAAAAAAPAIIFIDEIDALAPARSSGDDLSARRMLTELLLCMTALASRPRCLVFVMACTNRMEDCDPALLRRWVQGRRVGVQELCACGPWWALSLPGRRRAGSGHGWRLSRERAPRELSSLLSHE